MKKLAERIARSDWIDDYSLWRMSKNITYEIHNMTRERKPVPIEMIRLRAATNVAREIRRSAPQERR